MIFTHVCKNGDLVFRPQYGEANLKTDHAVVMDEYPI